MIILSKLADYGVIIATHLAANPERQMTAAVLAQETSLPRATVAKVLKALDLNEVRLLSNNPEKVAALENAGIKVVERVPCEPDVTVHSEFYLKTKKERMGHLFSR